MPGKCTSGEYSLPAPAIRDKIGKCRARQDQRASRSLIAIFVRCNQYPPNYKFTGRWVFHKSTRFLTSAKSTFGLSNLAMHSHRLELLANRVIEGTWAPWFQYVVLESSNPMLVLCRVLLNYDLRKLAGTGTAHFKIASKKLRNGSAALNPPCVFGVIEVVSRACFAHS